MGNLASLLLERSSSHDGPTHNLSDPNNWMLYASDGGQSAAGNYVNRESALSYSPVWGAWDLLACSVAKLPCILYVKTPKGRERATAEPAFNLVRHSPNPHMVAFDLFKTVEFHRQACGNGYIYIFRKKNGQPEELYPLNPDNTYEVMEQETGRLTYMVILGGKAEPLDPDDVIHVKGLSFDGVTGYKPLRYAKDSVGVALATQTYTGMFFKNGASTRVVIRHPKSLGPKAIQTIRDGWEKIYSGLTNAHKAVILDEGMEITPLTINARDSQLNETQDRSIRDIAARWRIPPHKLGDTTRTAYASLEQENLAFIDRLDDLLVPWEQELRKKLLTESQKKADSHYFEFLRQASIRSDMAAKSAYYRQALAGAPYMTANEVRALENMNSAGDEFDEIIIPGNIAPMGDETETPEAVEEPKLDKESDRMLLVANLRRVIRRLGDYARKASKDSTTFLPWLESNETRNGGMVQQELAEVMRALERPTRTMKDLPSRVFGELNAGLEKVYDTATPKEFVAAIDRRMDELEAELPGKIADDVLGV